MRPLTFNFGSIGLYFCAPGLGGRGRGPGRLGRRTRTGRQLSRAPAAPASQEQLLWRLIGLDTEEELGQVVEDPPRVGVVIFTSRVLQVVVALVVEHLVGGQVHRGIEKLNA